MATTGLSRTPRRSPPAGGGEFGLEGAEAEFLRGVLSPPRPGAPPRPSSPLRERTPARPRPATGPARGLPRVTKFPKGVANRKFDPVRDAAPGDGHRGPRPPPPSPGERAAEAGLLRDGGPAAATAATGGRAGAPPPPDFPAPREPSSPALHFMYLAKTKGFRRRAGHTVREMAAGRGGQGRPPARCGGASVCCWEPRRVKELWKRCIDALMEHNFLHLAARLPPLRPEALNYIGASRLAMDKRTLFLLLRHGVTRLHIPDFWELCNVSLPGWEFWRDGFSDPAFVRGDAPCMAVPDYLVEEREGILGFAERRWAMVFGDPNLDRLESLIVENQKEEDDDSGDVLRLVLSQLAARRSFEHLAIGYFENLRTLHLRPLLETRLAKLELSHLPCVGDSFLNNIICNVGSLRRLRLDFLPITDKGFKHVAGLTRLTHFEIKACPYMHMVKPFRLTELRHLRSLKINAHPSDAEMEIAHDSMQDVGAMENLHTLVIGAPFMKAPARTKGVFDLRAATIMRRLTRFEVYYPEQLVYPRKFSTWTTSLRRLLLKEPRGTLAAVSTCATLASLHICAARDMAPGDFARLAALVNLEELVIGGFPRSCDPHVRRVLGPLARLRRVHLHRAAEWPADGLYMAEEEEEW